MKSVGDRIREKRESLGMSQEELAKKLGYKSRSSINKIETDARNLTQSKIKSIADALLTTPSYIMGWEEPKEEIPPHFNPMPDMRKVPRVGRIACGEPITAEENIEDYDETPSGWHADFSLLCVGDSMSPKIENGDIVAIRCQQQVNNGEIAAVRIGDEATLKMVFVHEDYIELRPVNPAYPSIIRRLDEMEEIRIEGKAVGLCRNL